MTILLIKDVLDLRARAKKELDFYLAKKSELERKLTEIRKEINLTDHVLRILEKERKLTRANN